MSVEAVDPRGGRGPAGSHRRVAGAARRAGAAGRHPDARTEGGLAMLRTNLSTRPFYNERAVRTGLGALAALALGLTVFNAYEILRLQRAEPRRAADHRAERGAGARAARQGRRSFAARSIATKLAAVQAAAREANALIDRRAFSWTELFNQFQATLPADVRIGGVVAADRQRGPQAGADLGVLAAHRGSRRVHGRARKDRRVLGRAVASRCARRGRHAAHRSSRAITAPADGRRAAAGV